MLEESQEGNRAHRRPSEPPRAGSGRRFGSGGEGRSKPRGGLGLRCIGGDEFELVHPRCVAERQLDCQEGLELLHAGDVEEARDALRYALRGCGDNLWIHVALGRLALEHFHDPTLARGHFGYAFELVQRALPRNFSGRLPRQLPLNQPLYDAAEGLAACYEALGKPREAARIRAQAVQWAASPGRSEPSV